jgi:hypothetical protein
VTDAYQLVTVSDIDVFPPLHVGIACLTSHLASMSHSVTVAHISDKQVDRARYNNDEEALHTTTWTTDFVIPRSSSEHLGFLGTFVKFAFSCEEYSTFCLPAVCRQVCPEQ